MKRLHLHESGDSHHGPAATPAEAREAGRHEARALSDEVGRPCTRRHMTLQRRAKAEARAKRRGGGER